MANISNYRDTVLANAQVRVVPLNQLAKYASVQLYKWLAAPPASPPNGTSQFSWEGNGSNASYNGNDGWSVAIPANPGTAGLRLYIAQMNVGAAVGTATTAVAYSQATVSAVSQNGSDGVIGMSVATVYIYQRTTTNTAPATPSNNATFTFSNGTVSGLNNGWTPTIPSGTGAFLWVSTATASSSAPTDTIVQNEWAVAQLIAKDGTNGTSVTGPRGAGHFYPVGSSWSDTIASAACPGGAVIDDVVTISNGTTFVSEKKYNGSAWVAVGVVIDGGLLVPGSVTTNHINANGLSIKTPGGVMILDASGSGALSDAAVPNSAKNSQLLPTIAAAKMATFSAYQSWEFRNNAEGWSAAGGVITPGADAIAFGSSSTDPMLMSPTVNFPGKLYDKIRVRLRRTAGSTWDGNCFFSTSAPSVFGPTTGVCGAVTPDPTAGQLNQWMVLEFDMAALVNGSTRWVDSTISQLRFDFGNTGGNDAFEIDWISVGRYGVPASDAAVAAAATTANWSAVAGAPIAALTRSAIGTMHSGGNGDVRFLPNINSTGAADAGEIRVMGTKFYHPDGTTRSIINGREVSTPFEGTLGWDPFFLVYTDEGTSTRFGGTFATQPVNDRSESFFPAVYDLATGVWQAVDNVNARMTFTPRGTDCIVAIGRKVSVAAGSGIEYLSSLLGVNTNLPADGATADITLIGRNVTVAGNVLTKTAGAVNNWDADAYSAYGYTGGAYAEATVVSATHSIMFGLNGDPTADSSFSSLDYAFYIEGSTGVLKAYESNNDRGNIGSYVPGDVLAVTYDSSNVRYTKNGVVLKTVGVASGGRYYFDSSFAQMGGSLKNVKFGPMSSNNWTTVGGRPDDALNLVTKSRFEDSSRGGWLAAAAPDTHPTTVAVTGQVFTRAIEFYTRDTYDYNSFPVTPGETLYIEAWLDASSATQNIGFGLRMANAANNTFSWETAGLVAGTGWTKVSRTITVPADRVIAIPFLQNNVTVPATGVGRAAMLRITRFEAGATKGATLGTNVSGTINDTNAAGLVTISNLRIISSKLGAYSTAGTGGKMDLSDNALKIFDGGNALMIRIGNTSA